MSDYKTYTNKWDVYLREPYSNGETVVQVEAEYAKTDGVFLVFEFPTDESWNETIETARFPTLNVAQVVRVPEA